MGAGKKKVDENQSALEAQIKEQLKGIVYDEELVNELAPVFMRLQGQEGFSQVMELLVTKEKQIEAISGGDWFKKESKSDEDEETIDTQTKQTSANPVDDYLMKKYGETK
jgi:hypothetical protein